MGDESSNIVLDIGSQNVVAGFAGDDAPRAVFPSVVGRPKYNRGMVGIGSKDCHVGDEAVSKRGIETLKYPIENGVIMNYDDYSKLLHHTYYNELRIAPEEHGMIFSVPLFTSSSQLQKVAQILFEEFAVPGLAGVNSQALSTYSSGLGTACIVEIGHGLTQISSIYQGVFIAEGAYRGEVAGAAISKYMERMVLEQLQTRSLDTAGVQHQIDDLKIKSCYVAVDYEQELQDFATSTAKYLSYGFSDERQLQIGNARIRAPEVLFKPALIGSEELPLSHLIFRSIMKSPMDIRKDLFNNIVLSGGCTLLPGLADRLKAELTNLAPANTRIRIVAPPERRYSTWIGGSIYGSLSSCWPTMFGKEQYDEYGPSHVTAYGRIPKDKSLTVSEIGTFFA